MDFDEHACANDSVAHLAGYGCRSSGKGDRRGSVTTETLFDVYGPNAAFQWSGLFMVLIALILLNEVASPLEGRRTFSSSSACCGAMTIYCIAVDGRCRHGSPNGRSTTPRTHHMNSWFHYAKLYAATAGCIGFMMLKYSWGKIGQVALVQGVPVRDRGHQHPDRGGERLRERHPCAWDSSLGAPTRASRLTAAWHNVLNGMRGLAQHPVHDRLVRHLHLQEAARTCCGPT